MTFIQTSLAPKTKPEEATKKAEPSSQIQPPSSRFVASTAKAPHYYFSMDVDLSEIVGLQKLFKGDFRRLKFD